MKKSTVSATLGIALFLFIAACSKDNGTPTTPTDPPVDTVSTPPPPPTSTELLAAHVWKIDTIAFDANKDGTIDTGVPGGLQPCDMDNTLLFNSDSTGTFDEGVLKCVDTTEQSVPFTWYLKDNDSVVNITGAIPGELHGDINILKLNDSALVMSKPISISNTEVNLIISLKK